MQNKIIRFSSIDSTNTYALNNFNELDDMSVIIADEQTNGRGRFDRAWVSDDFENIYLSFVLKPQNKLYLANLTQYLSVIIAKVIESYGVQADIKYPNDVLINGKKICGILCESSLKKNIIQGVVLGVGVNLNMPENVLKLIDKPATSLNLETGLVINREDFLNKFLTVFWDGYFKAVEEGFLFFKEEYLKRIHFLGKTIMVQQRDGEKREEVVALKIDDNGNLLVKSISGEEKIIYSGDIFI